MGKVTSTLAKRRGHAMMTIMGYALHLVEEKCHQ